VSEGARMLEAARALVAAGLIREDAVDEAASVLRTAVPPPPPSSYSFVSDTEFIHASVEHHVDVFVTQVLEPKAKSHLNKSLPGGGRLLRDDEIQNAALGITEIVLGEAGTGYLEHLDRYFGSSGLAAYVYSRVHGFLMQRALKFNDEFLDAIGNRKRTARLATALTDSKPTSKK
jgi:hypothetical protein